MVNNQTKGQLPAISVTTEMMNWEQCSRVAMIDANGMATDRDKYMKTNCFQYYTCINTWLILIQDVMGMRSAYSVKNSIARDGLTAVISNAAVVADQLVQYAQGGTVPSIPMGWFMPDIKDMDLRDALQVLRFPKRFTPTNADILMNKSYDKFKEINRYDGITNHMCYPEWICIRMREHLERMLEYFKEEYNNTTPHFSAGTTTEGRTIAKKLGAYSKVVKYWCDPMYPIGDPSDVQSPTSQWRFVARVAAVPKNYKTYRIIAPEHPYYAAEKQRIKDAMRASIARTHYGTLYNPEEQGINQVKAFEGSITGEYATIDLSSASDTIATTFAYYVLPKDVTDAVYRYNNDYIIINNEWYRKRMYATSGDPVCFDTEAMIFLSIACSVRDICHELTCEEYHEPTVYGDDIIVDSRLFDTMMDVLSILRFIPNMDKSFGAGGYRESCGVEYYYGYDVSTKYWPRRTLRDPRQDPASLESLIKIEHRLFKHWPVVAFLTDVTHAVYPKITSSEAGTDCDDLWADSPWFAKRSCPFIRAKRTGQDVPQEWTLREAHTSFTSDYKEVMRWDADLDMYHYVNFLISGPIYEDPLDELQGISKPVLRDTDYCTASVRITTTVT